ncbi:glycosyl transferase [Chloroflexia bacterium SDU3-3]|nr:glycosyl transferase [Chloroflexia bacterium SDU3-3]
MSHVLFLCIPSHGHVNPMLGLASALIGQGERVTFFSSPEFKGVIEAAGADFQCYTSDLNIFGKQKKPASGGKKKGVPGFASALLAPERFIDDVLALVAGRRFDYMVASSAYPYASVVAHALGIPAIYSRAVFAPMEKMFSQAQGTGMRDMMTQYDSAYQAICKKIADRYHITLSSDMMEQMHNTSDLNIIYTSKYFMGDLGSYDERFIFIGPPIYEKKYTVDFPFDAIAGKKVLYISLGTVFGSAAPALNRMFFEAFGGSEFTVVMAAHHVDTAGVEIPSNFIIRDYVPQLDLLKHAAVAITHAGMNSMGDLIGHGVPFVSIPLGADQFYLARRAAELGATVVVDAASATPQALAEAVRRVLEQPSYRASIAKIRQSFDEAGGYSYAVERIFQLKRAKCIAG